MITEIFNETDAEIDKLLELHAERLKSVLKKLHDKILNAAVNGLPTDGNGKITAGFAAALKLQKAIQKEMVRIYQPGAADIISDFNIIVGAVEKEMAKIGAPITFHDADKRIFDALKQQAENTLYQLGTDISSKIAGELYTSVLTYKEFSDFADDIRHMLIGTDLKSKRGTPLASYAALYAHDSLLQFAQNVHNIGAKRAGLTHYLYHGDIIRDTRPFCIARAGKVFDADTVESWNGIPWKGKSGNVWTCRGGYNCRHTLRPVDPEWLKDGKAEAKQESLDEKMDKVLQKMKKATRFSAEKTDAKIKTYGTPTAEFRAQVEKLIAKIPPDDLQTLQDSGVEFCIGEYLLDVRPDLAGIVPRGWQGGGKTWEDAAGLYDPVNKKIVICEKTRKGIRETWETSSVFAHETGHAIDFAMNKKSASPEFIQAHMADASALDEKDRSLCRYFLQSDGVAAREETFAELYSAKISNDKWLRHYFPKTHEAMEAEAAK